MSMKSLVLGSAAALVAVSGARAADAIVAVPEPEPVEYVRVCDAYGAGFFYIPGTETCLSINGYVWYQVGAGSFRNAGDTPTFLFGDAAQDGWVKSSRVRVNFDARSETEWGTLRGYVRLQADWGGDDAGLTVDDLYTGPGDGPLTVDQAIIQLGGFYAGYTESAWSETLNGGNSNAGSHSWGSMYYGDQQRQQLGYNFGSGEAGFFGTISLEDDALQGEGYIPDVVGKVGYAGGWGVVWAKAGWDETIALSNDDSGFGLSAGLHWNVPGMEGSSLRVIGFYADSDNAYGSGSVLGVNPEWSVLASYYQQFTPTFGASIGAQYFDNLYLPLSDVGTGLNAWAAEASLVWTPVTNFEVRTEVYYDKVEDLDGSVSGFLRFTRYF